MKAIFYFAFSLILLLTNGVNCCTQIRYNNNEGYEIYDVYVDVGPEWTEYALNITTTMINQYNIEHPNEAKLSLITRGNENHKLISFIKEISITPITGPAMYDTYFSITFTTTKGDQPKTLTRFKGVGTGGGSRFTYYRISLLEALFK
jgi:hypothetical protein